MALDTSSASAGIRPGVRPDGRRQDGSTAAALHLALDGDHSRPHVTRVSTASPAHPHSTPSYASNAAGVHQEPDRAGQKTHMNPSSAPHGLTAVPAKGAILAGEMPAVVQGKPILELLQQFLALHHQRAQHYARLHLGFRYACLKLGTATSVLVARFHLFWQPEGHGPCEFDAQQE